MKKILLALLATSSLATATIAQTFSIRLTEPASGTITSGQSVTFTYYVKNVTNATINSGTQYGLGFGTISNNNYAPYSSSVIARTLSANIAPGDSIMGTQSLTLNIPSGTNAQAPVCIAVYAVSGTSATFNAASCRVYTLYNSLTEIERAASTVQVYPNPTNDFVNFSIDYNKVNTVKMLDITGREIETSSFNLNQTQIDVRNYKAGIYLYQILDVDNNIIKTGKITVNN